MSGPGMFDLTGKTAVITGSSRGIGRAIALRMAEAGARVVVSSRKAEACEPVAAEIAEQGGEAVVIPCNVSHREEVLRLLEETGDKLGPIDILVANAAANPVYGPMAQLDNDAFDKILDTNTKSHVWMANAALPGMAERGGGSMILVSSIAGLSGSKNLGAYAISKAADFQVARNLAVEWGKQNIRVNCIAPGLIKTDFARALWENPQAVQYTEHMTPLARIGEPDDIAGVAVFLASDAAKFITGQAIVADGGISIRDFF
ncbi:MAG: SDR family oxidoreductase [Xanthomonadales bacterium]|nr:SDR family oxidoreductase [Xanthomonadales bacterium]